MTKWNYFIVQLILNYILTICSLCFYEWHRPTH